MRGAARHIRWKDAKMRESYSSDMRAKDERNGGGGAHLFQMGGKFCEYDSTVIPNAY